MAMQRFFILALLWQIVHPFQLPNVFGSPKAPAFKSVSKQKQALLDAVSFTDNGKTATRAQQTQVLQLVRELELAQPPSPQLLTSSLAKQLEGVWYLQYTSPSQVNDTDSDQDGQKDEFPNAWKPQFASEGPSNIETRQFKAQGSISAAGVPVDTSNRVVQQIIDIDNAQVTNYIETGWGTIRVGGQFRPSPNIPNRAIVAFDTATIQIGKAVKLNLGFVFNILAKVRGSPDNGWLETTYIDDTLRIGRGNKGTMFILTRDPNAVKP